MTSAARITALVVPERGGDHLARALAALDWADERAVLTVDAPTPDLPADVVRVADPSRLDARADHWVLLLAEAERLEPADGAALRAACATAAGDAVFALPCILTLLDVRVRLMRPVARLAPRRAALVVRRGLELELGNGTRPAAQLDVAIVRMRGATLGEAMEQLGAETTTLAAIVDGRLRSGRGILWHPLVAGLRAVRARAARPIGVARWVLVVLEGYRVVVAYAKRWERRRDRVVEALA